MFNPTIDSFFHIGSSSSSSSSSSPSSISTPFDKGICAIHPGQNCFCPQLPSGVSKIPKVDISPPPYVEPIHIKCCNCFNCIHEKPIIVFNPHNPDSNVWIQVTFPVWKRSGVASHIDDSWKRDNDTEERIYTLIDDNTQRVHISKKVKVTPPVTWVSTSPSWTREYNGASWMQKFDRMRDDDSWVRSSDIPEKNATIINNTNSTVKIVFDSNEKLFASGLFSKSQEIPSGKSIVLRI